MLTCFLLSDSEAPAFSLTASARARAVIDLCLPVCVRKKDREKRKEIDDLSSTLSVRIRREIRDKRGGRVRAGQVGYRKGQAVLVCLFYPVSDFLPAQDSAHSHLSS